MSSLIKNHNHDNKAVIDAFTDVDGVVFYKGKKIEGGVSTSDITLSIAANNALKKNSDGYYVEAFKISTDTNNLLVKRSNGYFVQGFLISSAKNNSIIKNSDGYYAEKFIISPQANNALVKYLDGYYVPKLPVNTATLEDVANAKADLETEINNNNISINERYDLVIAQLSQIAADTRKQNVHKFENVVTSTLINVVTLSNLYTTSNIILNVEFMIVNNSIYPVTLATKENEIPTMETTIKPGEVQKYKLPNIIDIKINAKGTFSLYIYVDYI